MSGQDDTAQKYTLDSILGEDGVGTVYLGTDEEENSVVIKQFKNSVLDIRAVFCLGCFFLQNIHDTLDAQDSIAMEPKLTFGCLYLFWVILKLEFHNASFQKLGRYPKCFFFSHHWPLQP